MQASSRAMASASDAVRRQAFVTLCANDGYVLGAIVLAASLRGTGTQRQIVALITDQVSLRSKYDVCPVCRHLRSMRHRAVVLMGASGCRI